MFTFVHEGIHGAVFRFFGGKVKYGFKVVFAYTQETSGIAISRNKFGIVLLAPLVIISAASLFLPVWLGTIVFLLNLLGSSGDIYMAINLSRYNYDSKIID